MQRQLVVSVLLSALLLSLLPGVVVAQGGGAAAPTTIVVGQGGSETPNVDVTVELSQATFPDGGAGTVLIGRSDLFADSLASGVLQSDGPLLLVPTAGPVPIQVMTEIRRLGATRAVVLGGTAAVSEDVAAELAGAGLTVTRAAGRSRVGTAVEVARLRPDATTAILARAGGVEGNPTSGFADALAAGGWAAESGWPILLTGTEALAQETADYITEAGIGVVNIVGGTAAISEAVVTSLTGMGVTVRRVSGPSRFSTAVAIADARGSDSSADDALVILVDGTSDDAWAAGFGAAAMAAGGLADPETGAPTRGRTDQAAPVVLGTADALPDETAQFLEPGPSTLVCAISATTCEAGRLALGFVPALQIPVPPGTVTYTVANDTSSLLWSAQFDGSGAGLAFPCTDQYCTHIDWHARGERAVMAVQRPGVSDDAVYQLMGETLVETGGTPDPRGFGDDTRGVDAGDNTTPGANSFVAFNNGFLLQDAIGGAAQSGAGPGDAIQASFQGRNYHPLMAAENVDPRISGTLYLTAAQELVQNLHGVTVASTPQVQRRPGAQVIGAAWAPTQTGDIAIVDRIANAGVLRIAPYPDEDVITVADVDANSAAVWSPDASTLAVLADTDDGVSLLLVDATTGSATVAVADAGAAAAGGRIAFDGSGTLIAWHAGGEIRVVNTADGSVAAMPLPDGYRLVAGPSFRP